LRGRLRRIRHRTVAATFSSDTVNSFEIEQRTTSTTASRSPAAVYYIRWNNIQQTVVPPVCQISFISNLGQAVAKGVDIQAEVALTDAFTVELAGGYTEARYTRDSKLSATETNPVVTAGDAITGESGGGQSGQPNAPFTLSVGLEYKFSLLDQTLRALDDQFQSRRSGAPPLRTRIRCNTIPPTTSCRPQFCLRAGRINFGKMQFSAFCDNLFAPHRDQLRVVIDRATAIVAWSGSSPTVREPSA